MAAPVLTVALIAAITPNPGTVDLTALTGGIQGNTGADYGMTQGSGQDVKMDGGLQCVENPFGTFTVGSYFWGGSFFVVASDRDTGFGTSDSVNRNQSSSYNSSTINSGVFYAPTSDQKLRQFFWYGLLNTSQYQVVATPADGSHAPVSLNLPINTECGFLVTYRGVSAGSTIDIRITKTGAGASSLAPKFRYMTIPVVPPRPRGMSIGVQL